MCLFKGRQTHTEKDTDTDKVDCETWDTDAKRLLKTFIVHQSDVQTLCELSNTYETQMKLQLVRLYETQYI